jgi:hypothetical protein
MRTWILNQDYAMTLENSSKATLISTDSGIDGTAQGIQLAFDDATTLKLDPYDVRKMEDPVLGQGLLLARQVGIEPTTIRLTVERSTAELLPTTASVLEAKGSLAWCFRADKCSFGLVGFQLRLAELGFVFCCGFHPGRRPGVPGLPVCGFCASV